jgi:hypothetical protein
MLNNFCSVKVWGINFWFCQENSERKNEKSDSHFGNRLYRKRVESEVNSPYRRLEKGQEKGLYYVRRLHLPKKIFKG